MENLKTFIIDYETMTEKVSVNSLEEAKEVAFEGMGLTELDVIIKDEDGNEICRSKWYNIDPSQEENKDLILVTFGSQGYYIKWTDELELINN